MIKSSLLNDQLKGLQTSIAIVGWAVNGDPVSAPNSSNHQKDGDIVRVDWESPPSSDDIALVDNVIADHDPSVPSSEEIKAQNITDVNLRFAAANLTGKTPQQIYTAMQNKMDAWTSLADARADLREWLPLMAAGIVWLVKNGD